MGIVHPAGLVLATGLLAASLFAATEGRSQHPGSSMEHIQIQLATRIEGRLIGDDPYDEASWVDYTRFYDGRSWRRVPFDAQLQVYARDAAMMEFFRSLPKGTILRMTISIDDEGKRRVVALEGT